MSRPTQKLEALFEAALALPTEAQRWAYLDGDCPDPEMRREVESLLAARLNPDSLLAGEAPNNPSAEQVAEQPGNRIGRYKLLERIGEGGGGVVFMAEQEEPVRRKVALKLIKPGMDSRQVIARFEAERQALAMMDHPNIAKFLDAGVTGEQGRAGILPAPAASAARVVNDGANNDAPAAPGRQDACPTLGRPYFVMELVRGIRITDYCAQKNLSTRQRLDLFIAVCHAVQHAHQKGIIHRDLKPSNILVTENDGVPVPKVIDFGIAKATEQKLTDKTLFTQFAAFIGTPAYMSPEQAAMTSLDIDTRSDIYSLGVLLYELLTGTTPFDAQELLKAGFDEMRRIIRETEPEKPSTRLTRGSARGTGNARGPRAESGGPPDSRSTDQSGVVGGKAGDENDFLRGYQVNEVFGGPPKTAREPRALPIDADLDWIVMKCLEKDRARRYETANGLASDLQRHLNNEPVVARPPSAAYRVGKMVRRNKTPFAAAVALLIVAALGLTGVLTQWRRAEHQRTRAELQSQRAEANAAKERRERYYASIAAADSHIRNGDIDVALGLLTNCPAEFRHWEWGRLIYLCHQAISSTRVAPDQVDMLMVNADGTRAVEMPLHEKLARRSACWEVGTGREVFEVSGESSSVVAMAFSPDGQRFAAAQLNGQLRVWDARSGQLRSERHATNPVRSVLFSPDGERLAIVMSAGAGVILNPTNGQVLLATPSLGIEFRAAALDPAGRFWATMAQDGRITVRDARTGTERFSFQADPTANPLAFHSHPSLFLSPDGNRLLVNAAPNASRVWNLEASREILFIPSKVLGVAYSPDGSSVAVLSGGTSVDLWDLATGEKSSTIRAHQRRVTFVGFDASGARLRTASSDGTAKVWPALPGRERLPHTFHTDGVTYRPDGQRCVTTQADGVARVWDTASGRELFNFRGNWSWLRVASFSPDGQRIVTGGADRRARIFEADTGRELLVLTGHISSVRAAVFSPDGAKVATGSWDKTVRLWDAMTGAELLTLRGHADSVRRVVFSPDGQRLFSMAQDSKVNIWDTTTGRLLSTLSGGNNALAISPDGRRLVTGSFSGSVRLWNAMTGELLAKWNARGAVPVLDFSPDGRRLLVVTTDPNGVLIKPNQEIWEAETGRPLLVMPEDSAVFSARFSPDGHRILSGSFYARAARVWEAFPWEERLYDSRSSRREEAQTSTRNAERGTRNKDQSLVTSAPTPLVDRIQAYAAEYWRARLAAEDQVRAPTPAPSPEPLRFPKTAWPTRASDASPRLLDLTPYYNALLNVPWELVPAESAYDDDLSSLPTGIVTLSGVAFDVRGLVRLATAPDPFWKGAVFIPHPTSIEGIPVANQWRRLHVLHGADRTAIADGAPICRYVLRYADGERREIPVLYGRDVRTLWQLDNDIKPGDRGVVAWLGTNPAIARLDGRLRLYRSTFDNPRPEVPIQSIDVVSSLTQCIPFIIAITLEP